MAPFGVFKYLIYQQYLASAFDKFSCKIHQCIFGEIKVIHVDKQT